MLIVDTFEIFIKIFFKEGPEKFELNTLQS